MNRKLNIFLLAALGTIVCLVFLLIASVMSVGAAGGTNEYAHAIFLNVSNGIGGSDCFANDRPGDYFPQPDAYCEGRHGDGAQPAAVDADSVATDVTSDIPVILTTPTPQKTPVITATSTKKPELPTEQPTEKPQLPTDVPTEEKPIEVPEDTCKNKNQFKEGTSDCNAGGGND